MLRIRRICNEFLPVNKNILTHVNNTLRSQFAAVSDAEMDLVGEKIRNRFEHRFRALLFVSETLRGKVQGFATIPFEKVAILDL